MRTLLLALLIASTTAAYAANPRTAHYGYGYGAWYFTPGYAYKAYPRGYYVSPQGYYYYPRSYAAPVVYFYDPGEVRYYPRYYHNYHGHRR